MHQTVRTAWLHFHYARVSRFEAAGYATVLLSR